MPERFHTHAHTRFALFPLALFALVLTGTLLASGFALAADAPAKPWAVTRKADNRVLPKQDTVEDIETGRAMPDSGKQQTKLSSGKAPASSGKAPAKAGKAPVSSGKTGGPTAKTKQTKPAAPPVVPSSGIADAPKVTVTAKAVVVMLPTSAAVTDTRYLNLDKPRRLAMDVMGKWKYSGPKIFKVGKGPLEKIEVGKHPDFLRLVLHLTKGPVPAEIVPRFQLVEGGLRMTASLAR